MESHWRADAPLTAWTDQLFALAWPGAVISRAEDARSHDCQTH